MVAQTVKSSPAVQETWFNPWIGKFPWRREWLPTSVFFSGEFHRQGSLAGYSLWGRKESDTTEWLTLSLSLAVQWVVKNLQFHCKGRGFDPWLRIGEIGDPACRICDLQPKKKTEEELIEYFIFIFRVIWKLLNMLLISRWWILTIIKWLKEERQKNYIVFLNLKSRSFWIMEFFILMEVKFKGLTSLFFLFLNWNFSVVI